MEIENIDYVICPVCQKKMKQINYRHIISHGFKNFKEFKEKYEKQNIICGKIRNKISKPIIVTSWNLLKILL